MRRVITFILRLWVTSETALPACEGEVECVATGEREHIRTGADAERFIRTCLSPRPDSGVFPGHPGSGAGEPDPGVEHGSPGFKPKKWV